MQGVVSCSPAFLGRILRALGPVTLESCGETVTTENLLPLLDFHTQLEHDLHDRWILTSG